MIKFEMKLMLEWNQEGWNKIMRSQHVSKIIK